MTTCLPGIRAGELWLPNFVQRPLGGTLSRTTTQGKISEKCVLRLLPCDTEENAAGGGADTELSADN